MTRNRTQPIFAVVVREPSCPASITLLRTNSLPEAITIAESLAESEITDITLTDAAVKNHILIEYTHGILYKTNARTISYRP